MGVVRNILPILTAWAVLLPACREDYEYFPAEKERPGQELVLEDEFPIVAWTGLDERKDSDDGFIAMKECGINTYLWWYDTLEDLLYVLDNAEKEGIKIIARSQELYSEPEATVRKLMNHPALMGYCLKDEPEVWDLDWLAELVGKIQSVDKVHPCYVNIYPNWCWGGINGYLAMVTNYLKKVPVPFLSFDFYPIWEVDGVPGLREGWYANLEDARTASLRFGIPFWAFALSSPGKEGNKEWPVATVGHLRLQMFSNLVYGAQGFQYFTYHGICLAGAKRPTYNRVKTVNAELQSLGFIFRNATVKNVWHTGAEIPERTYPLKIMPEGLESLDSGDAGLVVSRIEKEGRTYYALVNKDFEHDQQISIRFKSPVVRYNHDGYLVSLDERITLPPGDITIFELK